MSGRICWFVVVILLISLICGCSPTPRMQLAETGIFGEHQLLRTEHLQGTEGSFSGCFFLAIGGISGEISQVNRLQFFWSPKPGEIITTSMPYDKLRFVIDENKETPTIEFVFPPGWADNKYFATTYLDTQKMNPNGIIDDNVVIARVRISKKTMEQEIYLPKPGSS